jgi:hypothetical protein
LLLDTPKWLFISGPSHLAHAKKKGKTTPNQRGIFGALQNKAKVNNRKRHESFKNNNFFMRPKNTRKSIDHQKTVENHPIYQT